MRKKILFIDFLPISGSCTGLLTEIKYINKVYKNKFECAVVGCKGSILESRANIYNYNYHVISAYEAAEFKFFPFKFILSYIKVTLKLMVICIKNRPHIIHCNHYMWSIYANPVGFFLNIPVVIHLKDVWFLQPKWARVLMKFNPRTRYIAVSKYVYNLFVHKYKIAGKKTTMIYDGIDSEVFFPLTSKQIGKKLQNHRKNIIYVSRVAPERDIEVFIDMAALLHKENKNLKFFHIGYDERFVNREYFLSLKNRIKTLSLSKSFKFIRYESDSFIMSKFYKAAYVLIVPARQFALPNIAIESMLCGTPVIAFKVGGNSEIISEESGGKTLYSNSPVLYFQAVKNYLHNPSIYKKNAIKGANYALHHFSIEQQIVKLNRLYNRL